MRHRAHACDHRRDRRLFEHPAQGDLCRGAAQLCSDVICTNYRLSPREISALQLLTNDPNFLWSTLREVIDLSGKIELQKKIQRAALSTSSGKGD